MGWAKDPGVETKEQGEKEFIRRAFLETIPDALMMAISPMVGPARFGGAFKKGAKGFLKKVPSAVEDLGVRYDGPWEFQGKALGHSWTDLQSKRTFMTKGTGFEEIKAAWERILSQ